MKKKVLCVCAQGIHRSKYLASYLKKKGYNTRYGGVDNRFLVFKPSKSIKQDDVDWADVIVIVRKRLGSIFKKKFKYNMKKLIFLDVTDDPSSLKGKFNYLRKVSYEEFARKYRNPMLRKGIDKYLPL